MEPFASLVTLPHHSIPRLLLNRETVGVFRSKRRRRTDVVVCSDVEESVSELAAGAGWDKDLNDIQREIAAKHSENGITSHPILNFFGTRITFIALIVRFTFCC